MSTNHRESLLQNGCVEPYRALQARIFSPAASKPVRTVLFTANQAREGCSTVVGNLAIYLSQVQTERVLLLELDVLHPSPRPVVPAARKFGLLDVIAGEVRLEDAIVPIAGAPLHVLAAGSIRDRSPGLLSSQAIGEILPRLKADFRYVLADGPVVTGIPPVLPLVPLFDGVILVTEANRTRRQVASHSLERLKSTSDNFLGVVMNQRRFFIPGWIYGRL